ncbi:SMI1/KNR4 family protein [Streptomyces sp. NA04227]|uniref:SMI1/KNR4 family protein n=1 Tax=Streptomyces sp. NA04227 TaxID=2742136 RepID=UPI0015914135|nr:SMI1/KNR4 family protein [Streptomyces sp. NA04227]QKW06562.1 SMI1/KNR4 family protein [Streptomyces sp. NA04227]
MADDPIETQTPKRRITDPAEALAALERAVPGLADHRRSAPAVLDWALVEESLGTALPSDYKHLAEWYPTFAIGDYILVSLPEPGEEPLAHRGFQSALEVLVDASLEPDLGLLAYPAPGGLLPWSESDESDKFMWSTAGETPQEWFVTVAGRGGAWWHYEGGAVQFLAELCDSTLEPWGLRIFDPEVTPC